jgi:hypothetical protein
VRGHESIFLTQLAHIEVVDPRHTKLVEDQSNGYRLSKRVFTPMQFQEETLRRALLQLCPRLLLADAVDSAKPFKSA